MKSFISVIKRQKRLNNTRNPEKGDQSGKEHKHLPLSYFGTGKMAFGKNDTYYQENNRLHQLKELEPRYVIYNFKFPQTRMNTL